MDYEWDEAKRRANIAKHGVDFGTVEDFDFETALVTLMTGMNMAKGAKLPSDLSVDVCMCSFFIAAGQRYA